MWLLSVARPFETVKGVSPPGTGDNRDPCTESGERRVRFFSPQPGPARPPSAFPIPSRVTSSPSLILSSDSCLRHPTLLSPLLLSLISQAWPSQSSDAPASNTLRLEALAHQHMRSLGLKVRPLAIWVVSPPDLRRAVPVLLDRKSNRTRPAVLSRGLQILGVQHQPDVRLLRHRHRSPQILQVH